MNSVDKICKSTKLTFDYIQDNLEVNLLRVAQESGLSEEHTRKFLHISRMTVEEGYQKSYDSFRKTVEAAVSGK